MNQQNPPAQFSRKRKLALGLACLLVVLFFLRGQILRRLAGGLVRPDKIPIAADVMALGGVGASELTMAWLAAHDDAKSLLVEKLPPRVIQIGATESEAERRRALALAAGVPADRVEVLRGSMMRRNDPVGAMDQWLSANPRRRIHVLCDQFRSRGLRRAVDRRFDPEAAARVSLQALVDPRMTVEDWWTTRLGMRAVFDAYLGLTRAVLGLGSPKPPPYLTADQYEQAFLDSLNLQD